MASELDIRDYFGASSTSSPFVRKQLANILKTLPDEAPIFGSLKTGKVRMPRSSKDSRCLTWTKFITRLAKQVTNKPKSTMDCWFAPASKEDGYHETKLSKDGSRDKFRTARMLRVLLDRDTLPIVESRDSDSHAIHRCGRGKGSGKGAPCCINPYHIYFGDCITNQDTKGCKYGAAFLCPHNPKCIWTDASTGHVLHCRSDATKRTCTCGLQCF